MFCSGLSDATEANILMRFLLKPEVLPVRYLGFPLCSKRLSVKDCDPLISQIRRKYNASMNRHLSLAGRLTLISSAIPGIIGFLTSAFCIPGKVLKMINSLSTSFLWHGCLDNPRGANISWQDVCRPKVEGGLGLRNSASWNIDFGLKLIWLLHFRAGSLWVAWMRRKYLSMCSFLSSQLTVRNTSWMFQRLVDLRPIAQTLVYYEINNGGETYFWWDPWTPFGPLIQYLGITGPMDLGISIDSLVCDCLVNGSWILPHPRSERQFQLHIFISTLSLGQGNDRILWKVNGVQRDKFISKDIWNYTRERRQPSTWTSLVWHATSVP